LIHLLPVEILQQRVISHDFLILSGDYRFALPQRPLGQEFALVFG